MKALTPLQSQAERTLYSTDPFAWAISVCMKHAKDECKPVLWGLLTDEQKDSLRQLARLAK